MMTPPIPIGRTAIGAHAASVARRVSVERVAVEVVEALAAEDVRALLLKGPAIESWLYQPGERAYNDVDLMVAPVDVACAHRTLTALSFYPVLSDDGAQMVGLDPTAGLWDELDWHGINYHRTEGLPGWVDLHRALWKTGTAVWDVLSAETDRLLVQGRELEVPTLPGRALIVSLHALQHRTTGPHTRFASKATEDLRRAVERGDAAVWLEAARMAAALGLEPQMASSLRLVAGGEALAARLGLPVGASADASANAALVMAESRYERLARASNRRARARIVARALFPSRDLIRSLDPRARRGPVGLIVAYGAFMGVVLRRVPSGLRSWHRARTLVRKP